MDHSKLFYVLNGFYNGERGTTAARTDGTMLLDGHYYFADGDDNADGHGPYPTVQDAWDARVKSERTQTWAFPLDGGRPFLAMPSEVDELSTDGLHNIATIEEVFAGNQSEYFECIAEGSYDTLVLRINAGSFANAADVFRHVFVQSAKYLG